VTQTKLKKLKIDVVSELHTVRRKHAGASSAEIEQGAEEIFTQIRKRKQQRKKI
jgi:hypothetical protein